MATELLDDLATRLQTAGVGTVGTNIFKTTGAVLPQGSSVVLIETGGTSAENTHNNPLAYRQPTVQVIARATAARAAKTLAEQAFQSIGFIRNTLIGSNWVRSADALQDPIDLGRDEKGLFKCGFNIRLVYNKR